MKRPPPSCSLCHRARRNSDTQPPFPKPRPPGSHLHEREPDLRPPRRSALHRTGTVSGTDFSRLSYFSSSRQILPHIHHGSFGYEELFLSFETIIALVRDFYLPSLVDSIDELIDIEIQPSRRVAPDPAQMPECVHEALRPSAEIVRIQEPSSVGEDLHSGATLERLRPAADLGDDRPLIGVLEIPPGRPVHPLHPVAAADRGEDREFDHSGFSTLRSTNSRQRSPRNVFAPLARRSKWRSFRSYRRKSL